MTDLLRIRRERSVLRDRLQEIGEMAESDLTDEIRAERADKQGLLRGSEVEYRAALDDEEAATQQRADMSGESAEKRRLLDAVTLADYGGPAASGGEIRSQAAELNAAMNLPLTGPGGGPAVPWEILEIREDRAFTTSSSNDGSNIQRPILQRLFGPGIMDALGVRIDSVPVGRSEWPLITSGTTVGQVKEGTAAGAAVAAGFSFASLKPKRLTGRFEYSHELAASVSDIEQALRRDVADDARSKMSNAIINGATPDGTNPERIEGLITEIGTATDLSSAEATAADYGKLHALAVDGIHAESEDQVMSIIGDETYVHSSGTYITGSGLAGSQLLKQRSGGCYASTYIPNKASMKQSAILHAARAKTAGGVMRGDSVAAVWPVLEIIRDIYSKASQGIILSFVMLWDAKVALRAGAYKHIAVNIG